MWRVARGAGLGLASLAGGSFIYVGTNPEKFLLGFAESGPSDISKSSKSASSTIVSQDPFLSSALTEARTFLKERTALENKPLLLLVSGMPFAGAHRVARQLAISSSPSATTNEAVSMDDSDNMVSSLVFDSSGPVVEVVQDWLLRSISADWKLAWLSPLIHWLVNLKAWEHRFLPSEDAALEMIQQAMERSPNNFRILLRLRNSSNNPEKARMIQWIHKVIVDQPSTVAIVSSSAAPFAVEEILQWLPDEADPIQIAHVKVGGPDLTSRHLHETDEGPRTLNERRVAAVFHGVREELLAQEDRSADEDVPEIDVDEIDEIFHALTAARVGFRLERLVCIAQHYFSALSAAPSLKALDSAIASALDEEITRISERLHAVDGLQNSSEADLSVWTWEVLEILSGAVSHPNAGRPADKAVPPLPSTLPDTVFSARDIPALSFGLLECRPVGEDIDEGPSLVEMITIPKPSDGVEKLEKRSNIVAAEAFALAAFRRALALGVEEDSSAGRLIQTMAGRRSDLHRREDEAAFAADLEDYTERRASFHRSERYFREFLRDHPGVMEEMQVIANELEIRHLRQRFDLEQQELEERFAHLWPIPPLSASLVT